MSKKSSKTFCLAFIRRRINTTFRSRALRAALLAELNGGEDAALVVQMIERVRPVVNPPTQAVAPMPQPNEEEVAPETQVGGRVRPVDPPTQAVATPQPDQVAPPDGLTAASAVEISDSEDELVQEMRITPERRRRLREQLQSWRSSNSDKETLCVLMIEFVIVLFVVLYVYFCNVKSLLLSMSKSD